MRRQEVKLENTLWYDCPPGERIEIPGYNGVVECPDLHILCKPPKPPPPPTGRLPLPDSSSEDSHSSDSCKYFKYLNRH